MYFQAGSVGHFYVAAHNGSIGSAAVPFRLQLLRAKLMPDGSPATMPAELIAIAGDSM